MAMPCTTPMGREDWWLYWQAGCSTGCSGLMGDVLWDALATFTCGCLCGGFDATTDGFALLWLGLVWFGRIGTHVGVKVGKDGRCFNVKLWLWMEDVIELWILRHREQRDVCLGTDPGGSPWKSTGKPLLLVDPNRTLIDQLPGPTHHPLGCFVSPVDVLSAEQVLIAHSIGEHCREGHHTYAYTLLLHSTVLVCLASICRASKLEIQCYIQQPLVIGPAMGQWPHGCWNHSLGTHCSSSLVNNYILIGFCFIVGVNSNTLAAATTLVTFCCGQHHHQGGWWRHLTNDRDKHGSSPTDWLTGANKICHLTPWFVASLCLHETEADGGCFLSKWQMDDVTRDSTWIPLLQWLKAVRHELARMKISVTGQINPIPVLQQCVPDCALAMM